MQDNLSGIARAQILVAEDNVPDVFLVREALALSEVEHDLHVVEDGEEALRFIERADFGNGDAPIPALLLLDLNLPKRTGDEILVGLRQSRTCRDIPVIIMTSSDSPKDREEAARLGAVAYFRKPSDLEEFLKLGELVRDILEK